MNIIDIKTRLERNEVPFKEELPEKLHLYLNLLHRNSLSLNLLNSLLRNLLTSWQGSSAVQ